MILPKPACRRCTPFATALQLLALLTATAATAQVAPCGLDNRRDGCIDQDSVDGSGVAVANNSDPGDRFGAAVAIGDFDGDGFGDLAVGAPGEGLGGVVQVFMGDSLGLGLTGQRFLSQNAVAGDAGGAEANDDFGATLAAGDFNGDGFDDLAIGARREDYVPPISGDCGILFAECIDAGLVHVVPGSATGLVPAAAIGLIAPIDFTRFDGTNFGFALATGDFDDDGRLDLVVGSPAIANQGEGNSQGDTFWYPGSATTLLDLGQVVLLRGGLLLCADPRAFGAALAPGHFDAGSGLELAVGAPFSDVGAFPESGAITEHPAGAAACSAFVQSDYGSAGESADDRFGSALAAADFDGDGADDLAASAPFKNHGPGNPSDSGRTYVAYGGPAGLDPADFDILGEDRWSGHTPAVDEHFGAALAAGDVDGDGFADLLVGAPNEGATDVGNVFVEKGSGTGLTDTGNRVFSQTTIGGTSNVGNDHFGSVLAVGDLDGDGKLEIVVGVPDKDVNGDADAGMVYVTRAFDPSWIFADSFESAGAALWSAVVP